jgi:hypothetical protein
MQDVLLELCMRQETATQKTSQSQKDTQTAGQMSKQDRQIDRQSGLLNNQDRTNCEKDLEDLEKR